MIIKTGPDFGKRILRPQLFSRRPLKDPGFWILDSETFLVLQSTGFVILDSGFSGGKSRLSSFELKSQLSPCSSRLYYPLLEGMDSGSWILDLAWHLAILMSIKGARSGSGPRSIKGPVSAENPFINPRENPTLECKILYN